jgi:hypothetical protein
MSSRLIAAVCVPLLFQILSGRGEEPHALIHTLDGRKIAGIPQRLTGDQLMLAPDPTRSAHTLHPGVIWHLFTGSLEELSSREPGLEAFRFSSPLVPGVLLTNGAFFAGEISGISDTAVTVKSRRAGEREFPVKQIARIQFNANKKDSQPTIPDTATGVISDGGVFSDGDIISVDGERVVIDSIFSGPQTFRRKNVHAVLLSHAPLGSSRYILTLTDGSRILTDSLSPHEAGFGVDGLLTGSETISLDILDQLSAGYQFLEDVCTLNHIRRRPELSEEDDLVVRNAPPTASNVQVDTRRRKVEIAAGSALAFFLDQPGNGFSARIAVPEGYPEGKEIQFRVRADDKLVYQSKVMKSGSPPELIGFRARMSRYLVLEVLPVEGTMHETPGLWIEPVIHLQ